MRSLATQPSSMSMGSSSTTEDRPQSRLIIARGADSSSRYHKEIDGSMSLRSWGLPIRLRRRFQRYTQMLDGGQSRQNNKGASNVMPMNDTNILIVILAIAYVVGGFFANIWATKHWPDSSLGFFVTLVTAPACVFILFTAAALSLVAFPFVAAAHTYRERKFSAAMKDRGRFRRWDEIVATPTEGTVIIEQAQKDSCRVWWTSDDVAGISPHPIPDEESLDYLRVEEPLPFIRWCAETYTSPTSGRAQLTEFPFPIPSGFLTPDFLRSKAPIANVIATVKMA